MTKKLQVLWRQSRVFDKHAVKVMSVYSKKESEDEGIAARNTGALKSP